VTLEQLRIFVAVAERQHVTEAARALNLAQSAVSHAISALETRHDARLFDRVGRRIELTEAGRALLVEARVILAQVDHAELTLSAFGRLERGTLSLMASQTIASYWLPRHLVTFRRAYPGIRIALSIGNTAQVAECITGGAVELGFVEGRIESEDLVYRPIARDQMVLVTGPDHPWQNGETKPGPLTNADLLAGDWVLREPGSGTRLAFEEAMAQLDIPLKDMKIAMELPSNEAVRAAVEAGLGATALSASVCAASLEAGLLCPVRFRLPDRAFYLLRHGRRCESRIAAALMAMMDVAIES